ncbi:unnamed protein product, partial [Adineta ricciae]
MLAYSQLQQEEFQAEKYGYTAVRHQREVGTGYFDLVTLAITGKHFSIYLMKKISNIRPIADKILRDISSYVHNYKIQSSLAFDTARLCFLDTLGCGLEALKYPQCTRLIGPIVPGAT